MELYKHCGSCPARVICDYGCMAVHDQDPHHFIDGCVANKRLYAYMEFRRGEVEALAQRFISRTRQKKYIGRSRDLDRIIALRKKLFGYMELTGETVCTVSKDESDIQVRANNQTKVLTSFDAAHLMKTRDRC
jgi:hypothetical protein